MNSTDTLYVDQMLVSDLIPVLCVTLFQNWVNVITGQSGVASLPLSQEDAPQY